VPSCPIFGGKLRSHVCRERRFLGLSLSPSAQSPSQSWQSCSCGALARTDVTSGAQTLVWIAPPGIGTATSASSSDERSAQRRSVSGRGRRLHHMANGTVRRNVATHTETFRETMAICYGASADSVSPAPPALPQREEGSRPGAVCAPLTPAPRNAATPHWAGSQSDGRSAEK